ncbi:MAG: Zn-ribbon domain-containing OB-fold protein [Paracoccus sp. (in: a-proteobacteria)]|uniref:Zn-ribbon domain-containing OB-fold protein n=1 Tax=Paracoccus sp. TaxID=267 RepID=UPI0039E5895B
MSGDFVHATAETAPYWAAARDGKLVYQHCENCAFVQFPPRNLCAACGSDQPEWRESRRSGRVESFTVVHRAPNALFRAKAPYVIALVQLDEGFRIMVNIFGDTACATRVGSLVRIVFASSEDGAILPQGELVA